MKHVISITIAALWVLTTFVTLYAYAGNEVITPQDFFAQVLGVVQQLGGMSGMAKISAVILLIVASMKVSFLNDLLWSKLGAAKAWVAPLLGLIGGILGIGASGVPLDGARILAYVTAGAGAVVLHELLDSIKAVPGIGNIYLTIINIVQGWLGGPAPKS
jgi:hypothetical protein